MLVVREKKSLRSAAIDGIDSTTDYSGIAIKGMQIIKSWMNWTAKFIHLRRFCKKIYLKKKCII